MGTRKTLSGRWKPALVVLGLLAALGLPAAGDADTITKEVEMVKPFAIFQANPCTGEPVELTGQQHLHVHVRTDSSGGTHATGTVDTHGSGMSLAPPFPKYSVADRVFVEVNLTHGAEEQTFDFRSRVTRAGETGSPDDFYMRTQFHMTFDADGDATADFFRGPTLECDREPITP